MVQKIDNNKIHFYWLDTMRFVAAFMVLLSHSRNTFFPAFGDLPESQQNIFSMAFTMFCRMGHEAVIVFFVLSGFLVGGRGFERIQDGSMNVSSYAIDRFARICPPPPGRYPILLYNEFSNTGNSIFLVYGHRKLV